MDLTQMFFLNQLGFFCFFVLLLLAELGEDFKRYEDASDKYHEAGFDAYVTGCIFATLTNYLGNILHVSYFLFFLLLFFSFLVVVDFVVVVLIIIIMKYLLRANF